MTDIIDWKDGDITLITYKENGDIATFETIKKEEDHAGFRIRFQSL